VLIDSDLKLFSSHIEAMVPKDHQRASLILRCFKCRDPVLLYRAFVTYVRPILEYNCQVWSPAYLYLTNKIEWVQKSFTKRLNGLSARSYSDRLIWLGADSLATHRLEFDHLVLFYDIVYE